MMSTKAAIILGAGFSYIAGLPLAKDLFKAPLIVYSRKNHDRFKVLQEDYFSWTEQNPNKHAEQFLQELYSTNFRYYSLFSDAVNYICTALAYPLGRAAEYSSPRYKYRLDSPSDILAHRNFFYKISQKYSDYSVITTNYDILIEKVLRHKKMKREFGPGFVYGGLDIPQLLNGTTQPYTVHHKQNEIILEKGIKVYKLHGSLNWVNENSEIKLYVDLRPAFRTRRRASIIPPLPEKTIPKWLSQVWREAEQELNDSRTWIICGYSFPEYDEAFNSLIHRVGNSKEIYILDPFSDDICSRLNRLLTNCRFHSLKGLPEGIDQLF